VNAKGMQVHMPTAQLDKGYHWTRTTVISGTDPHTPWHACGRGQSRYAGLHCLHVWIHEKWS